MPHLSSHTRAALLALLVTVLWSSSWVLIKLGLEELPALTFAGMRYTLAWVILLGVAWRRGVLGELRRASRREWRDLAALGLPIYAVAQGAQFLALEHLSAATLSLLLNFTTVVVAFLGIALLAERPTAWQWAGIALYLAGALLFLGPTSLDGAALGLLFAAFCVTGNALGTLAGRGINRRGTLSPLAVTTASMGMGAPIMLAGGLVFQAPPQLSLTGALIIAWLAVVNTALAFTLWNASQRILSAVESSVINNTMLIQIAILAWIFLGESLSVQAIAGLALAAAGSLIVQVRRAPTLAR